MMKMGRERRRRLRRAIIVCFSLCVFSQKIDILLFERFGTVV